MSKSETGNIVMSADALAKRVHQIGAAIRDQCRDEEVLLLCILKGGAVLTADLLRAIPGSVCVEFIDKILDIADTEVAEATEIDFVSHCNLTDRNVYIIKDVVATGVIESYLMSNLRMKKPKELRMVTVVDRPEARTAPFEVDYAVFAGGEGSYIGYGLEGSRYGANLPDLRRVIRDEE